MPKHNKIYSWKIQKSNSYKPKLDNGLKNIPDYKPKIVEILS